MRPPKFVLFVSSLLITIGILGCTSNPDIANTNKRVERIVSEIERELHFKEYNSLPDNKSMAIAISKDGRLTAGWGSGYSSLEGSNERALKECEKRREKRKIETPCKIYTEGEAKITPKLRTEIEWKELNREATKLSNEKEYDRAFIVAKKALEIAKQGIEQNNPSTPLILENMAFLYMAQGSPIDAEPYLERSLNILENTLPENHIRIAQTLEKLALTYRATSRYKEAQDLELRATKIRLENFDSD